MSLPIALVTYFRRETLDIRESYSIPEDEEVCHHQHGKILLVLVDCQDIFPFSIYFISSFIFIILNLGEGV